MRLTARALPFALVTLMLAAASSLARPALAIPEELKPWQGWVLHGHERELCPELPGLPDTCAWPSRLELSLDASGGRFTQEWLVHARSRVQLPGSPEAWPQDARLDGAALAVVADEQDMPAAWLEPGTHRITGSFRWESVPESLRVPAATGLVALSVNGRSVSNASRDAEGRLWLQQGAAVSTEEAESLELAVHRRVTDAVPLTIDTRLLLNVAGRARELMLGPALPEGFIALSLEAALPARLEADGRLRLQVRPGRWVVTLAARHVGPVSALTAPSGGVNWSPDEVWAFDARPDLRVVSVEGVPAIDPQQTAMPEEWKSLPTFRLLPGETMRLDEKQRGDAEPAADQLNLQRMLWLDFDGGGLTAQDQLGGVLTRSWRLESNQPWELGRASVGGEDQLLTRRAPDAPAGLEIRQGQLAVVADSRLEGSMRSVPAVGWDADVSSLSMRLQLPPGWRLLAAPGADIANGTWISRWTLLDLFLALIVTIAIFRLWGWPAGALAFATMALTVTESGAPKWVWLFVVSLEAIRRVLKEERALHVITIARLAVLAFLMIVAVGFMLVQARQALHPQLENPWEDGGGWEALLGGGRGDRPELAMDAPMEMKVEMAGMEGRAMSSMAADNAVPVAAPEPKQRQRRTHDPREIVQTGPGVPTWSWRVMDLSWSGPVDRTQQLRLMLMPPTLTSTLGFLRVLLLAALILRAILPRDFSISRRVLVVLFACIGLAARPSCASAEVPRQEVLDDLRDRLVAPPDCNPNCAQILRLALEAEPTSLRLRLEIAAAAEWPLAIPGTSDQWTASTVLLDGRPAEGIARAGDGLTWLLVPEGVHQVILEGPLPDRAVLSLALPSRPRSASATSHGWVVTGIHENGRCDDTLQLAREESRKAAKGDDFAPSVLPPFITITRRVDLGLTWSVSTDVRRLGPSTAPVVVRVPLLPGESVSTADVRVESSHAAITLGPGVEGISWWSTLEESDAIDFVAPETTEWTEIWQLDAAPSWHVEPSGIPPIHSSLAEEMRVREWRPWPGERVSVAVTRPDPAEGASLTIDSSALALSPGLRATDATLTLMIRSSRGGQHQIELPEGAELLSLNVNGLVQPPRQDGRVVSIAITPGMQQVTLTWRQDDGLRLRWKSPLVDLRAGSVNAGLNVTLPRRWLLYTHGPRLGPAVLFWSLLAVIALVAFALSRWRVTPLGFGSWLLLFIGLSQVSAWMAGVVVAWFLLLAWRRANVGRMHGRWIIVGQVLLALWTATSLGILFIAIHQGLLGDPQMQVTGNGSSAQWLQWTADRADGPLPIASIWSAPLLAYRLAMLAWALWLAAALIRWLRWAWDCFTEK